MKRYLILLGWLALVVPALAQNFPIRRGLLQSDLNAGGLAITNLPPDGLRDTNGYAIGLYTFTPTNTAPGSAWLTNPVTWTVYYPTGAVLSASGTNGLDSVADRTAAANSTNTLVDARIANASNSIVTAEITRNMATSNALVSAIGSVGSATNFPPFYLSQSNSSVKTARYSTNMSIVSSASTGFAVGQQRVEVSGDTIFISSSSTTVKVYTNRAAPVLAATLTLPAMVESMRHLGPFFYLCGGNTMVTYNASIPASTYATATNTFTGTSKAAKFRVQDGLLFVATYTDGLTAPGRIEIFTLDNPAKPLKLSTMVLEAGTGAGDVIKVGRYLYHGDYFGQKLHVIDIADPTRPVLVCSQAASDGHGVYSGIWNPWNVEAKDNALYVMDDNMIQVYNLNNPTNPVYTTNVLVEKDLEGGLQIDGDLMITSSSGVNSGNPGIAALDIQNALLPVRTVFTNTGWSGGYYWTTIDDDYIYHPVAGTLYVLNRPQMPRLGPKELVLVTALTNTTYLPLASNSVGRVVSVRSVGVSNVVTAIGNDRIDGGTSYLLGTNQASTFVSDGLTNWFSLASPVSANSVSGTLVFPSASLNWQFTTNNASLLTNTIVGWLTNTVNSFKIPIVQ